MRTRTPSAVRKIGKRHPIDISLLLRGGNIVTVIVVRWLSAPPGPAPVTLAIRQSALCCALLPRKRRFRQVLPKFTRLGGLLYAKALKPRGNMRYCFCI
jgi:hypothetical protein